MKQLFRRATALVLALLVTVSTAAASEAMGWQIHTGKTQGWARIFFGAIHIPTCGRSIMWNIPPTPPSFPRCPTGPGC